VAVPRSEGFGSPERTDDGGRVALVGVDFGIEVPHFFGGDFVGEIGERSAKLREFYQGVAADDRDGVVGREIMIVVDERNKVEGVDESVGGIAGDDVNFLVDEGAIDQAKVHDTGRRGEMQAVESAPATKAVGTLEEFVAEAGAHFGGVGDEVAGVAEVEALGVFAADDHGESVLETEWFGDFQVETLGIALFDAIVDVAWVAAWGFVEHGGEGGAGVFDVEVEVAGEERFLAEERAAEIGFAFDVDAGAGFDVLGQELREDDLLGEKFGADGEVGLLRLAAGQRKEIKDGKEVEEAKEGASHVYEKEKRI
jgi:hypothetical protein